MNDDESFGARLRHERERRQISLDSIADRTKIGLGLLKGLERDDLSRWPAGIFRRSFIRSYAEATGLDADEVLGSFLERFPEPVTDRADEGPALHRQPAPRSSGHTMLRLKLADDTQPFLLTELCRAWRTRCQALAWDLMVLLVVAAILALGGGELWMPLAFAAIGYFAGAVLLLGNTPGSCLAARRRLPSHRPNAETPDDRPSYSIAPPADYETLDTSPALQNK